MSNPKPCYIYTLSGKKEAHAAEPEKGPAGYDVCNIKAIDGTVSMFVAAGVCKRKYESEDKPTFYAC